MAKPLTPARYAAASLLELRDGLKAPCKQRTAGATASIPASRRCSQSIATRLILPEVSCRNIHVKSQQAKVHFCSDTDPHKAVLVVYASGRLG